MNGFNRVILAGNLTRDPELRYTAKGTAVTTMGLAVNRKWKDDSGAEKEETTFIDVQTWAKQAETACQYLKKGSRLLVEGRLKMDEWEENGQRRTKIIVAMESMTFLDSNPNASQGQPRARTAQGARP
jgi:single-strand DNA-binding protein